MNKVSMWCVVGLTFAFWAFVAPMLVYRTSRDLYNIEARNESVVGSLYVRIGDTRLFIVECKRTNSDGTATRYYINCPYCNGQ